MALLSWPTGSFDTEYPGLNDLAKSGAYGSDFTEETISELPVNTVFQSYHLMVAMFGLIGLTTLLAFSLHVPQGTHCLDALAAEPGHRFASVPLAWPSKQVGLQQKSAVNHGWCTPPPAAPRA